GSAGPVSWHAASHNGFSGMEADIGSAGGYVFLIGATADPSAQLSPGGATSTPTPVPVPVPTPTPVPTPVPTPTLAPVPAPTPTPTTLTTLTAPEPGGQVIDGSANPQETLRGGPLGDLIISGQAGHSIFGGGGGDHIVVNGSGAWVEGGDGADTIEGGTTGLTWAYGQAGADTFVYQANTAGQLWVGDFEFGTDTLKIQGSAGPVTWHAASHSGFSGMEADIGSAGGYVFLIGVSTDPSASIVFG
ncbi:MAG TPA: hypothetical protein VL358_02110, partial [Caulobacteraceae bacterium]|nr:hypothetical protein [Caulobacteraceae bacterium]